MKSLFIINVINTLSIQCTCSNNVIQPSQCYVNSLVRQDLQTEEANTQIFSREKQRLDTQTQLDRKLVLNVFEIHAMLCGTSHESN